MRILTCLTLPSELLRSVERPTSYKTSLKFSFVSVYSSEHVWIKNHVCLIITFAFLDTVGVFESVFDTPVPDMERTMVLLQSLR